MPVTIPHMGNVYLAVKALFDGLRIPYVLPEPNSRASLQTGSSYSPDEICLPFKLMMGNYIDSIKKGADTIVITGSCGPCRFGEYCELQMRILRRLGYDLDFIVLDLSAEIGKKEFLRRVRRISDLSPFGTRRKIEELLRAVRIMERIDRLETRAHELAGYEVNRGDGKRILRRFRMRAEKSSSPDEMLCAIRDAEKELDAVPLDLSRDPLRIAVIGEIYTVIEPFSNLFLEEKLTDHGVSVRRHLTPTWWLKDLLLKPLRLNSLNLRLASREYLPLYIGGHGRECIGEAVSAQKRGLDGAIQVFPLGCMPEIVSKAILPALRHEKDFPIMTLVVDEMTGEAGHVTRLEAFLDLLKMKRSRRA